MKIIMLEAGQKLVFIIPNIKIRGNYVRDLNLVRKPNHSVFSQFTGCFLTEGRIVKTILPKS
jgi:hypothetical protein